MEENKIREQMVKLYNENSGFARMDLKEVAENHQKWLKLKRKADKLRDKREKLYEKERKEMVIDNNKTFVNSYGEATKREITNTTYEKSRKKTEREFQKIFLGI